LKKFSPDAFDSFLIKIASIHFENRRYLQLSNIILNIEPEFSHNTISIVKTLAYEILVEENYDELENMKSIFLKVEERGKTFFEQDRELWKLFLITHFQFQKIVVRDVSDKLPHLYYCICLCILYYGNIIKMDVALYNAYNVCVKLKSNGNAFVFANRFLDLYDSIESKLEIEIDGELKVKISLK
jgi:hypothetical protein